MYEITLFLILYKLGLIIVLFFKNILKISCILFLLKLKYTAKKIN